MSLFTVCNKDGPRIRHGAHGRTTKRNIARAAGRRVVLPGYPIPAGLLTAEQLAVYLSSDRITCLLCGKAYRRLGWHLEKIHGVSLDEYRDRYGLPYSKGVLSAASAKAYSDASIAAGRDGAWMAALRRLRTRPCTGTERVSAVKRRANMATLQGIHTGIALGRFLLRWQRARISVADVVSGER